MLKEQIIEVILNYENPYPKDLFEWDNKESMNITRGRFNEFVFNVVEYVRRDLLKNVTEFPEI